MRLQADRIVHDLDLVGDAKYGGGACYKLGGEEPRASATIIGFCSASMTILGGCGFLALQPIKDNIAQNQIDQRQRSNEFKDSIAAVVDKMETQKDLEYRQARSAEDRQDAKVKGLREALVPLEELDRVLQGYNQRFADIVDRIDHDERRERQP